MNPKQDRPGARTPEDLERKYKFGENFYEINETLEKQNMTIDKQQQTFANYVSTNDKAMQTMAENYSKLLKKVSELEGNLKTMGDNISAVGGKVTAATDNMCKAKAGFIYPFAGGKVPEGFLLCNGSSYSRTAYPELFAAIGTTWGAGNGSTTFNVPNLAKRVPVGVGSGYALGATGGEEKHTLTTAEMPGHSHTINIYAGSGSKGGGIVNYSGSAGGSQYGTNSTAGSDQPHNNMQPYAACNYIIATGKTFVNTST